MTVNMDIFDVYTPEMFEPSAPPIGAPGDKEWTAVKIERTVLDVIEGLSFLGVLTVGALSCASVVVLPVALAVGVPLAFLGGSLLYYRSTLIDYENGAELSKARFQAMDMSLTEAVKKHGWENIMKYEILSPWTLRTKFYAESTGVTAAEFLARYDLSYLKKSGCLNAQQAELLQGIKAEHEQSLQFYHRQKNQMESICHRGVSLARQTRDQLIANAAPNDLPRVTVQANRDYDFEISMLALQKDRDLSAIRGPFEAHLLDLNTRFLRVLEYRAIV